ncbi:hypothetical protein KFK09_024499 [Dendrobium nobile]|uniref:CCHC-type domain-containing protein n=1 Tax=Dendrobium nobile TaxID=94219 RepID=A0A8T3AJI1_DENNO|nr:hypothetical protein KFK09_024499 [Dendrobium nobile]
MDRKGKKIETEPAANFPLSSENMDKFVDKVAQMVSDKLAAKRSGHVKKSGESSRPRTTPVCTSCGRRHMGQCYRRTGQCFRCGARGHRMTECPSFGWRQVPVPMASTVPTVPTDLVGNEQEMEEDAPGMPANVTGTRFCLSSVSL